jgi:hypothetical protein
MRRAVLLGVSLVAAFAAAAPGSARQAEVPGTGVTASALGLRGLDSRLAQVAQSGRVNGAAAALDAARTHGFLVAQGKVRVVVRARAGQVAGARAAVRLAQGKIVFATGRLIEALVAPAALPRLAASRHVARVHPVRAPAERTSTGLTNGAARLLYETGGADSGSGDPTPETSDFEDVVEPGAPTSPVAQAGDGQATIFFTPPDSDGGDPILYYTATAYPGGQSASSSTPGVVTIGGLTNGVSYSFTITATNAVGTGAASDFSNVVTPDSSSRLDPDPAVETPRPSIPGFGPPSGPRGRPPTGIGEY